MPLVCFRLPIFGVNKNYVFGLTEAEPKCRKCKSNDHQIDQPDGN